MVDRSINVTKSVCKCLPILPDFIHTLFCDHCKIHLQTQTISSKLSEAAKVLVELPDLKNVVRGLLEANGRGMWETDNDKLDKLRGLYNDADDMKEQVDSLY